MRTNRYASLFFATLLLLLSAAGPSEASTARKRIVILAGKKSHGPVGNGIHDYGWSARLIKTMLDQSNVRDDVEVDVFLDGWPTDHSKLESADSIMIISDGRDGDLYEEALHLQDPEKIAFISKQVERGCGLVTFHFSTFAPDRYADQILDWTGGYFDWETDGKRQWYSAIQTANTNVELAAPDHPVSRGVQPFQMNEEFYFNLRFNPVVGGITPILKVPALPGRDDSGRVVAWARQRPGHGRGFGTTCGHFYDNWKNDDFRKLILNGLIWSAGVDVPTNGVVARVYSHEEIDAALSAEKSKEIEPPLRVLLLAGNDAHKWHNWEKTTPRIKSSLERDPRIIVEVVTNIEELGRRPLEEYQAIVLNYCNWQDPKTLSDAAKNAFMLYLQRGGGLVVIHFANGAFHYSLPNAGPSDWPEYRKIVRRVWDHTNKSGVTSGHDAFGPFHVDVTPTEHPVTKGLDPFDVVDELYFQQVGDDPIEPLITAHSKITNKDEPLAFAYRYGDGRVFQTLLGHSEKTYDTFEAREMVRRAAAWVSNRSLHPLTKESDPNPVAAIPESAEPLVPGRFGRALNARVFHAACPAIPPCRDRPITVECWVKLASHTSYNIILGSEVKASPFHWSLFTEPTSGVLTMYFPTRSPDHVRSAANICDGAWHYVAAILEKDRTRLVVDGKVVADHAMKENDAKFNQSGFALGGLVEKGVGCDGLIDEVRLSRVVRDVSHVPSEPFPVDESVIALWRFNEINKDLQTNDESPGQHTLKLRPASEPPDAASAPPVDPHFDKGSVGFHWKEADSADDRWNATDIGPFLASVLPLPGELPIHKGLSIRIGDKGEAAVCYDTERMQWRAGWTGGFLKFSPVRHGLISPPNAAGEFQLVVKPTSNDAHFKPQYISLEQNGTRVVLSYAMGETRIKEHPWFEPMANGSLFTRALEISPSKEAVRLPVGTWKGQGKRQTSNDGEWFEFTAGDRLHAIAVHGANVVATDTDDNTTLSLDVAANNMTRRLKILLWSGSPNDIATFTQSLKNTFDTDLTAMSQPGNPLWKNEVLTHGTLGTIDGPLVVDNLPLPIDNPYHSLCFASSHDFFSDGQMAVSMVHGDVWIVSGIDESLGTLRWKRFATGLFQPLGLRIINDQIYVLGRDQITRLVDRNNDGEADSYDVFFNGYQTSDHGHDYVTCLETDAEGRFYFLHANQGLLRLNKDGKNLEVLATGLRNPNGLSIGPTGIVTASPQEGNWTPTSSIVELREGAYYGYPGEEHLRDPPRPYTPPLCWIPRLLDNSSGGQVWISSKRWGNLQGGLLHLSYGQCKLLHVLREQVGDVTQGGVVSLPAEFRSGVMRGRFSPVDEQLYLSGLKGWVSSAVDDGCLVRVRPTGKPLDVPIAIETMQNGLSIRFNSPLDKDVAEDADRYDLSQWNYLYSMNYGSDEYSSVESNRVGREEVTVRSATLLPDGQTVFLEIPDIKPVMQLSIHCRLQTVDKRAIDQTIAYTINKLGSRRQEESSIVRRPRLGQLPPDIEAALHPGLLLNVGDDTIVARQLAWAVPDGSTTTLFSSSSSTPAVGGESNTTGEQVSLKGYLKVTSAGDYRFKLEGNSAAQLIVGNSNSTPNTLHFKVTEPVTINLHKGFHPIQMSVVLPTKGDRHFRLLWSSDAFVWEPIPATVLFHDSSDSKLAHAKELREGYWLYHERSCGRCHDATPSNSAANAPDWTAIGSRLEPAWIAQWLLDPKSLRPQSIMPHFFDPSNAADRQTASDIATYLSSLKSDPETESPSTSGDAEEGLTLYENLGCLACHHREEVSAVDDFPRLPLRGVPLKFRGGQLESFLSKPESHYSRTRMPDFLLTAEEAGHLATYLRELPSTPLPELPTGNAERGHTSAVRLKCFACHQGEGIESPVIATAPIKSTERGCMANEKKASDALSFPLSDTERASLIAYIRATRLSTEVAPIHKTPRGPAYADSARHLVEYLGCAACHSRDGVASSRGVIFQDESETGLPPESIPDLTWGGEKLRARWLRDLLAGKTPERTRPWLKARMPAFPAYADELATGLAAEHGLIPTNDEPFVVDAKAAEMGKQLVGLKTGLDCRQCHAIGQEQPFGDDRTQLALGINFVHVRQRMRTEHYRRFVLDPPRFDVATRMPKLAFDGHTTKIHDIYDGDAAKQFEAIWNFIQSLPTTIEPLDNAGSAQ